jgi:hypothetical protein
MAISTYTELKTAVANWLDRDDLTDRIPEFIALAEARMNRVLRLRMMEAKYTASTVGAQRNYALPTGYLQMRNFQLNTSPITTLSYVSPEIFDRLWGGSTGGTPQFYTILANEIQLGPIPASVQTMEMLFYKKITALSGTNLTEQMLTDNPDIYLYGALLEAEPFIMNDERVSLWALGFEKAVANLQEQDNKDRHSGSALRVMNTSGYY